jgi:hypothetical protein
MPLTTLLCWAGLRWKALVTVIGVGFASYLSLSCGPRPDGTGNTSARDGQAPPNVRFKDITDQAGVHFRHTNGAFGLKLLPETMGSGVAFIDFDQDGRQDILFVNSCYWPGHEGPDRPTLKLYRNKGGGVFEDVTEAVGLNVTLYGMGATVGDYDNDGWPDIFVSGVGGNRLFRNLGGKRFEDVTATACVGGPGGWTTQGDFTKVKSLVSFPSSATFVDYDGDGWLDLFVCNYITWSPDLDLSQEFQLKGAGRAYGPPWPFEGAQCTLYRNLGNGRFEDVTERAGIRVIEKEGSGAQARERSVSKSLGVIACDVDADGRPDLIVANDTVRNFLFHNKGDGTFEEIGLPSGVGLADGRARGAMGIDYAEYCPGQYAVVLANFADEPTTFLRRHNSNYLLFSDQARAEGIADASRAPLKFGTFFFDYDLDGRLDLFTCNGHLEPDIAKVFSNQSYEQPIQLFWNSGGKPTYVPVTEKEAGADLFRPLVGRGCAFADIDGDGYPDVVVTVNGGQARLFHNEGGTGHNWIRLVLEGDGSRSNRSAVGARVTVKAGDLVQVREVTAGRGYLSQSELPLTFGLGKASHVDSIRIQWPGVKGGKTELGGLAPNKTHVIRQDEKR